MALDILGLLNAVESHASASGWFEQVNGHEPLSPPATGGLTCAVWVDALAPSRTSGLATSTARLTFNVRLYTSMTSLPLDAIDPNLLQATDALMRAYIGGFTLGGLVRHVDVFGAYGPALDARAGYIEHTGMTLRVMTITLPVIVSDLWDEVA